MFVAIIIIIIIRIWIWLINIKRRLTRERDFFLFFTHYGLHNKSKQKKKKEIIFDKKTSLPSHSSQHQLHCFASSSLLDYLSIHVTIHVCQGAGRALFISLHRYSTLTSPRYAPTFSAPWTLLCTCLPSQHNFS